VALRLLHFDGCPFCDKVRLALRRMALDYEPVPVDPGDRAEVERLSGQRLVPVLCDADRIIPDSTRILRYLVARYGERGLLPARPGDQALAWIVEDYADEVLGPVIDALLEGRAADGRPLPARDRKEIEKHLETEFRNLEQLFADRPFAFGDAPTLADIALYAFLSRLPRQAGHEISAGFPHLKAWYQRMEAGG
jgi:glutathione S-transferase